MSRIYLDNAASTPIDPLILEQMIEIMRTYHGNPSSVHFHGRQLRSLIEKSRKEIAELIGAAPAEVFFTSGGTVRKKPAIASINDLRAGSRHRCGEPVFILNEHFVS